MNIIVAVDKKWGIGNKGKLLVSIPRDKKLFREETTGKVIIMGHNTLFTSRLTAACRKKKYSTVKR